MSSSQHVLVLGATGKQGSSVCDALLATKRFVVHGFTRSTQGRAAKQLSDRGVQLIEGDVNSKASIESAIKTTGSKFMFIVTLFGSKSTEIAAGKAAVDAAVSCQLEYVVFSSVADADVCYENVTHFKSKFEIENYLKSTSLNYGILRPVAFLDNYDDAATYNPLTRGSVKGIWRKDLKVMQVACRDIGKAAARFFSEPASFNKKTLVCVSCNVSGEDVAKALTAASSEECKFSLAMPSWLLYLILPDLSRMVVYFEEKGYSCNEQQIAEFKQVVPDAVDAEGFFRLRGRWANGEAFGSKPAPQPLISLTTVLAVGAVAVGIGAAYYVNQNKA